MQIQDQLFEMVLKHPHRCAIKTATAEITYQELFKRSLRIAHRLKQNTNKNLVGLAFPASEKFNTAYFATLLAGKIPVLFDYTSDEDIVREIVRESGCTYLLCSDNLVNVLNPFFNTVDTCPVDEAGDVDEQWDLLEDISQPVAGMFYTGKSVNEIKHAAYTHTNLLSNAFGVVRAYGFNESYGILSALPSYIPYAVVMSVIVPVLEGASVLSSSNDAPQPLLEAIEDPSATVMIAEASSYKRLVDYVTTEDEGGEVFSSLMYAISTGGVLTKEYIGRFEEYFHIRLFEAFGRATVSPVISANTVKNNKRFTCGKPLYTIGVKVVTDKNSEAHAGEEGRVLVSGPSVAGDDGNTILNGMHRHKWVDTGCWGFMDEEGFLTITDCNDENQ